MKPSIPKGTRDFSPQEMVRRNYIFDIIKQVFQRYGYLPIETPAMENLSTLMGKYGEEGDKLIFKILESGEYTASLNENIVTRFNEIILEESTRDKFKKLAIDFAKQISNSLPSLKGQSIEYIKEYYLMNLSANEFIKNDFRPDFWFNIKKIFVDYLSKRPSKRNPNEQNRKNYLVYLSVLNEEERERKIKNSFLDVIKSSSKLREIIRIEAFSFNNLQPSKLNEFISKKALRYDLTVPFARYVVQHQNEITFPFKRYQIQPVWRADRPQKGRYREFYQCDADVVGSNSLINEVELVQMMDEVFTKLNVPVVIKINNRKILSGIAEVIGEKERIIDITVAIDKLDKIGPDGVNKELSEKGISDKAIEQLQPLIAFKGNTSEKLSLLKKLLASSEIGKKGIEEIEYIFKTIANCQLKTANCELDITLARGLNYYTGAIFEVKANAGTLTSSICGGGRYDDLTGIFGLPNVSGVGISFGADRIYDVLNELNLYPESVAASTKLLFVTFGEAEQNYCLPLLTQVRKAGINAEIYPDANAKMKKQMSYADSKKIPFVVIVGSDEMQSGMLSLKNMESGEQTKLTINEIIKSLT